jgi:ubiquinone/menaquinone biosynthesis C-methylase UbiE
MNVFLKKEIASNYDLYYQTEIGKKVSQIEENLFNDLLIDVPKTEMLELGCGTGQWTEYFINQGFKLTGIDISEEMLKIAQAKNLKADILKADSSHIPFDDNSFFAISSITMLEFVEDQDRVLQEIHRVLKPNGWIILGFLNANSELGKNKENDEVFGKASFLNPEKINQKLHAFNKLKMKYGVYFTPTFEILDGNSEIKVEPTFIAVIAQKKI